MILHSVVNNLLRWRNYFFLSIMHSHKTGRRDQVTHTTAYTPFNNTRHCRCSKRVKELNDNKTKIDYYFPYFQFHSRTERDDVRRWEY